MFGIMPENFDINLVDGEQDFSLIACESCSHWTLPRRGTAAGKCRRKRVEQFDDDDFISNWPRTEPLECCRNWTPTHAATRYWASVAARDAERPDSPRAIN